MTNCQLQRNKSYTVYEAITSHLVLFIFAPFVGKPKNTYKTEIVLMAKYMNNLSESHNIISSPENDVSPTIVFSVLLDVPTATTLIEY